MDNIIKKVEGKLAVDQQHLSVKQTKRSPGFIADVAADIENDWRVTVKNLTLAYGLSMRMFHNTPHQGGSFCLRTLQDR